MLKIRSYIFIALIVYVIVLLSALPASLLVGELESQLGADFKAHDVSGTLWNGNVKGEVAQQVFQLDWDLNLLRLFLLELSADVIVKSELVDFKARLALAYKRIDIDGLNGVVDAKSFNYILQENGLDVEIVNDIFLQKITLSRANAEFTNITGKAVWDGGLVKVEGLPSGSADLPPLEAILSPYDEGLSVRVGTMVSDAESAKSLVDVDLSHDGRAHLKLKERVADFVPVPSQLKQGDPEGVMFEIKREVFDTDGAF